MYVFIYIVYSFVRKGELYNEINRKLRECNISGDSDNVDAEKSSNAILNNINEIILSSNLVQFSKYLETTCKFEKNVIINNKESIYQYLKENNWKKGEKLFDLFVKQWNE